jgi:tryptophan synthase alpha chain
MAPQELKLLSLLWAKAFLLESFALTSQERIRMIAWEAMGFVYCVSSLGVTGVRKEISSNVDEIVRLVEEVKDIPCAIGFGISSPEQAAKLVQFSDGIIVGSAIVKIVGEYGTGCVPYVADYVETMKQVLFVWIGGCFY